MNQNTVWWSVALVVVLIIALLFVYQNGARTNSTQNTDTGAGAEMAVTSVVVAFGGSLDMVSLLAPAASVAESMEANYAPYVAPELLAQWESDPAHAPGRLTSSPAPDHIEVSSAQANADGTYTVLGRVIETTSAATATSTGSGSYPVTIRLENRDGSWLITQFQGYPPQR